MQINPFTNQTLEPRLGDEVTAQLRQQLQRDGTYHLASHNDGDIVVSGSVTRYVRQEVSLSPSDTLTVRDYRLELRAQVTASDRSSGKVILNQPVTGYTLIRVTTDLTSTERQAMPLLAADLAKNVTALLAEGAGRSAIVNKSGLPACGNLVAMGRLIKQLKPSNTMLKSILRIGAVSLLAAAIAGMPVQLLAQSTNTPAATRNRLRPKRTPPRRRSGASFPWQSGSGGQDRKNHQGG